MVEIPAAALCAEDFDAAFYSIGSNDLTQYTMAAARDNGAVADLNDAGHPAVLALIARTVKAERKGDVEVALGGGAAADIRLTTVLLATGLMSLSVAPVTVARLKALIAKAGSSRTMQAKRSAGLATAMSPTTRSSCGACSI